MNNMTPKTTKIIIGILVLIILCLAIYITSQPRVVPPPGGMRDDLSAGALQDDMNRNPGIVAGGNTNGGPRPSGNIIPGGAPLPEKKPGTVIIATPVKNPLASTVWIWKSTTFTNRATTVAPNNEKFVLRFDANGRASSATDCNSLSGTYSVNKEVLRFGPLAGTKMACQGASLEMQYAGYLSQVETFQISGSKLILNLSKNAGTMTFERKLN